MPRLRRFRLLAGLLLLASPAVGGTILPAVHPCPVDSPWLAHQSAQAASAAGHEGHHGDAAPEAPHENHTAVCHCISGCVPGATASPPSVGGLGFLAVLLDASGPVGRGPDASLDLSPQSERLPPATAPPPS